MKELISSLFFAVVTAAVPVLVKYAIDYIKQAKERVLASTNDIKKQGYIKEIADAITDAVAATSQTYVDGLKKAGKFDADAQKKAAQKAITACLAAISPPAKAFAESAYGDLTAYLANKIEAEVRKQKGKAATLLPLVGEPFTAEPIEAPDATVVTDTATATATSMTQSDVQQQVNAEPSVPEASETQTLLETA